MNSGEQLEKLKIMIKECLHTSFRTSKIKFQKSINNQVYIKFKVCVCYDKADY